jgi:hypothetical protein
MNPRQASSRGVGYALSPYEYIQNKSLQHFWKLLFFPDTDMIRFAQFEVKLLAYLTAPLSSEDEQAFPIPPFGWGLNEQDSQLLFLGDNSENMMKSFIIDAVDLERTGMITSWQLSLACRMYDEHTSLPQIIICAIAHHKGQRVVIPTPYINPLSTAKLTKI